MMRFADWCSIFRLHCNWSTFLESRTASVTCSAQWNSASSE